MKRLMLDDEEAARTRLVTLKEGNASCKNRALLRTCVVAILLHGMFIALVTSVPALLPTPVRTAARQEPVAPPTIEMVMDDNRYSGGGKTQPTTPSKQSEMEKVTTSKSPDLPPQRVMNRQAVTVPPPEREVAVGSPAPVAPDLSAAQVDLDPSSGIGFGHQDDPLITPAKPDNRRANKMPVYPVAAGRRGEEGTVELLVMIGADGAVTSIDIATTSGHPDLDQTARDAIARWHFRPAMQDGKPVPTQIMQVFNFKIDR
jgi:periplasmic protein TonB